MLFERFRSWAYSPQGVFITLQISGHGLAEAISFLLRLMLCKLPLLFWVFAGCRNQFAQSHDAPPGCCANHSQWRGNSVTSRPITPSFGRPRLRIWFAVALLRVTVDAPSHVLGAAAQVNIHNAECAHRKLLRRLRASVHGRECGLCRPAGNTPVKLKVLYISIGVIIGFLNITRIKLFSNLYFNLCVLPRCRECVLDHEG